MDNIILIVMILILIFVGFMIYQNTGAVNSKSKLIKKDELEREYIAELNAILSKCETKEERTAKKKVYMQELSSELSRNIFFDELEAKQLLQKLAVL